MSATRTATSSPTRRREVVLREGAGWLIALAFAVISVSVVATGTRAGLLFQDGDALLPVLISHSLSAGEEQDWALSSVLFVPELAVFLPIAALGLSADLSLALAGVVWLALLYGAFRLVAGAVRRPGTPVVGALLAFAGFCALMFTEASPDSESADLASLAVSSTYYVATVVAVVATIGLIARWANSEKRILLGVLVGAISLLSSFTNPLYAVWGILPIVLVGAFVWRRSIVTPAIILLVSGALGMAARLLVGDTIVKSGLGYIEPINAFVTASNYMSALMVRIMEPLGVMGVASSAALLIAAGFVLRRAKHTDVRFVSALALFVPIIVVVAFIAMGAETVRYLQPLAFAPLLLLTLVRIRRVTTTVLASIAVISAIVAGFVATPAVAQVEAAEDADLACVLSYAEASAGSGGGQFWSIRLPKSRLSDPSKLVQIDYQLRGYDWLVNRTDYDNAVLTYLVIDTTSTRDASFAPLDESVLDGAPITACGRYDVVELNKPVVIDSLWYRN